VEFKLSEASGPARKRVEEMGGEGSSEGTGVSEPLPLTVSSSLAAVGGTSSEAVLSQRSLFA